MKIRGSVVSLSLIFPNPPEDEKKKKKEYSSVTPLDHRGDQLYITHCPGGVSGYILEPGIVQLHEFESPRVRTSTICRLVH